MTPTFWHSWTITILYWIAFAAAFYFGAVHWVWAADVTHISAGILGLFQVSSLMALWYTYKKSIPTPVMNILDYVSTHLTALGMLGTILGLIFIIMNGIPAPQELLIGVGTALTTTLTGLICTIILNLQLTLLDGVIDEK